MKPIDRRTFLQAAALGASVAALPAPATAGGKVRWRKAFMLGGVSKGPVLEHFKRLRDAGFEGVELVSPNELDRDEVLKARDETGLVIHGVSGSRHWKDALSDPDPAVRSRGVEAILKEIEDCRAYGGTTVLVVPAIVTKDVSHRDAYEHSQIMFAEFMPAAEKAGARSPSRRSGTSSSSARRSSSATSTASSRPTVGAYFDVGNVVEFGFPQEWIRELGHRILKVHIKEYAKPKRFGYPLGEGEIDWPAVTRALDRCRLRRLDHGRGGVRRPRALKDVVRRMDKILSVAATTPTPRQDEDERPGNDPTGQDAGDGQGAADGGLEAGEVERLGEVGGEAGVEAEPDVGCRSRSR